MPLSPASAAVAARRCPSFAEATDGGSGNSGGVSLPKAFDEYELVVEPEPESTESAAATDEVTSLLSRFREKEQEAKEALGSDGAAEEPDLSAFGKRDADVDDFAAFSARVSRAPEQCIRYTFAQDASPLWASRNKRPLASGDVPCCERCGAPRRFEVSTAPRLSSH